MSEKKMPEVRFKGFSGEWEKLNLHDIATMKARIGWQGLTQKEFLSDGDYYLITGTDFNNGKIDFKNCHFIEQERYQQDINIQIKNDDVLITKDGTIGKVAYVSNIDKPATLNAGVFVIRARTKEILNLYLYHYLAAPYLLKYANEQATGGTIKHLNQNVLVGFPVPISEYNEQTKIGEFFKNFDNLISQNQKKYDKIVNIKKACLDKMFPKDGAGTPEVRFNLFCGKWINSELGEATDIYDGTHQTPKYTESGIMFLSVENIKTLQSEKYISEDDFINDFKIYPQKNDILMTRIGDIGTANVVDNNTKKAYYVSLALLKHKKLNPYFLKESIHSQTVKREIWHKTLHIAFPKKINKNEIEKVNILFPSEIDEQSQIGTFFQSLDNLITLQKTKLEKLKNIKKACLDKMFI